LTEGVFGAVKAKEKEKILADLEAAAQGKERGSAEQGSLGPLLRGALGRPKHQLGEREPQDQ